MIVRELAQPGYERVVHVKDPAAGLSAFIAIHSTAFGPAAGGCRFWAFDSEEAANSDALRLARGMSYKNAVASLPLGGGKAVIMKPKCFDRRALFSAFGKAVEALHGRYITAEDVGTSPQDMEVVSQNTKFVSGIRGGDPSPFTAKGVFLSICEAARFNLHRSDLQGLRVSIQGVGHVGRELCQLLAKQGAVLTVADVNEKELLFAKTQFGAKVVNVSAIHQVPCEIFAPCALGGSLNETTVPQISAQIVCGAANNQLLTDTDGDQLHARGVTFIPDYVANAGGIINVAAESLGWTRAEVQQRIQGIPRRVKGLLQESTSRGLAPHRVASQLASRLIGAKSAAVRESA